MQQRIHKSLRAISTVVFDFDYTLVDSAKGATECINVALTSLGLPAVVEELACQTIGLSLAETFLHLVGHEHAHHADLFEQRFVAHADKVMVGHTSLFGYAHHTIRRLKQANFTLGIVSTNRCYRIEAILERDGWRRAFSTIIGGEHVARPKPDPEGLLLLMARQGCTPAETLYVGDSVTDAETARRAGVMFAAVTSGVTPAWRFSEYPVACLLNNVAELATLLCEQRESSARLLAVESC